MSPFVLAPYHYKYALTKFVQREEEGIRVMYRRKTWEIIEGRDKPYSRPVLELDACP